MNDFLWISLGAIIGANLRYLVSRFSAKYLSADIPFGTFIVNLTGSFILGFFLAWTLERVEVDPRWRSFVAVGFCGAYTTFSTYSYETYMFLEQSDYGLAALNFICNNLFSLLAVIAGIVLARAI
ncbi:MULTISPECIES: fluoride efflux transporter CrcB [Legionella]|uniref:Fluoride-specific ion channel FluC n=1 Tax=Legionella resiliens TaxID=2905958 RepID=A0ABS8X3F3_9GAMM|nr:MULTISPECIES: fluoride efflux transporter CrcB [unclassified Legionella]MCE0722474.1 fluoride efflux transporter CrcB [Legionella sp. 9fVS26]MCE3531628.1 fluoride efflux transporter CrcB [Legionella sp. 8cVS16]QLZ67648.1 fluoride efflux transporter CrcB [Legionella sp. PC1000]